MVSNLQLQVAEAVRDGAGILEIEDVIIDPAPLDAEEKAALWLYAEAVRERHNLKRALELLGAEPGSGRALTDTAGSRGSATTRIRSLRSGDVRAAERLRAVRRVNPHV
jgi:hypothetical protein